MTLFGLWLIFHFLFLSLFARVSLLGHSLDPKVTSLVSVSFGFPRRCGLSWVELGGLRSVECKCNKQVPHLSSNPLSGNLFLLMSVFTLFCRCHVVLSGQRRGVNLIRAMSSTACQLILRSFKPSLPSVIAARYQIRSKGTTTIITSN